MSHLQRFSAGRGARSQLCRKLCSTMLAISSVQMAPRLCLRHSRASQFWFGTGPGSSVGAGTGRGRDAALPMHRILLGEPRVWGSGALCARVGSREGPVQRPAGRVQGYGSTSSHPNGRTHHCFRERNSNTLVPPRGRRGSNPPTRGKGSRSGKAPAYVSRRQKVRSLSPKRGTHQRKLPN